MGLSSWLHLLASSDSYSSIDLREKLDEDSLEGNPICDDQCLTLTSIRNLGLWSPNLIFDEFGCLLFPDASYLLELLNRAGLVLRVRGRLAILYLL